MTKGDLVADIVVPEMLHAETKYNMLDARASPLCLIQEAAR